MTLHTTTDAARPFLGAECIFCGAPRQDAPSAPRDPKETLEASMLRTCIMCGDEVPPHELERRIAGVREIVARRPLTCTSGG